MWVDNDIVIRERIPDIDQWLQSHTGLISKGFNSQYGRFKDIIRPEVDCCAGLFGLPPYFDLEAQVKRLCGKKPLIGFDEQGMVAYIVSNLPDWIQVDYFYFRMWGHWQKDFGQDLPNGIHFVGANRLKSARFSHAMEAWRYYRMVTLS